MVYFELFQAVSDGNTELATELIEKSTSITQLTEQSGSWTLLQKAAFHKQNEIIKLLLDRVNDKHLTILNKKGKTALHYAVEHCCEESIIEMILERMDDKYITMKTKTGNTLLHLAVITNNVKLLISLFGKITNEHLVMQNNDGHTFLHYAARLGHLEIVQILFEKLTDEELNIQDQLGDTPLINAVNRSGAFPNNSHVTDRYEKIVYMFLERLNSDQLSTCNCAKNDLAHMLALNYNYDMCQSILEKLPYHSLTLQSHCGKTPLMCYIEHNKVKLVQLLLDKLSIEDIFFPRIHGKNILHYAIWSYPSDGNDNPKIIEMLLDKLDYNWITERNAIGHNALHYAVQLSKTKVVQTLLNYMKSEDRFLLTRLGKTAKDLAKTKEMADLFKPLAKRAL